jgi:hypothetical protein
MSLFKGVALRSADLCRCTGGQIYNGLLVYSNSAVGIISGQETTGIQKIPNFGN